MPICNRPAHRNRHDVQLSLHRRRLLRDLAFLRLSLSFLPLDLDLEPDFFRLSLSFFFALDSESVSEPFFLFESLPFLSFLSLSLSFFPFLSFLLLDLSSSSSLSSSLSSFFLPFLGESFASSFFFFFFDPESSLSSELSSS